MMNMMRYIQKMNLEFRLCNCKNGIKVIKENNKMEWLIIFILILFMWWFFGYIITKYREEEYEKRRRWG